MALTLRQLTYFKALADHLNFGRAAASCHVTQPALSVQIREMEAHLGARLVERGPREVLLTPFGAEVLARVDIVLAATRSLEDLAQTRHGPANGLRLGLIPTVAPYLLPGLLGELRRRDIQRDVQVMEAKTEALLDRLAAGHLDAAVVALPVAGFHAEPLFEDRFVLAGAARSVETLPLDLKPDGLGQGQLLLLEDGHCLADQALELCGRDRTNDHISMEASSLATLTRLAAAGFGMTLLPEIAIAAETKGQEGLALRRFAGDEPSRQIGLVRRRTTPDDGWFTELADIIARSGRALTAEARP